MHSLHFHMICFGFLFVSCIFYVPFFVLTVIFMGLSLQPHDTTFIQTQMSKQLILSHRNLRELDSSIIATFSNQDIEYIDISHNRITKLEWMYKFPHLRCLIMDDNRLREAHLEKLQVPLTTITTLTLNKNEVGSLYACTDH